MSVSTLKKVSQKRKKFLPPVCIRFFYKKRRPRCGVLREADAFDDVIRRDFVQAVRCPGDSILIRLDFVPAEKQMSAFFIKKDTAPPGQSPGGGHRNADVFFYKIL
jgi:hypothetical protein